MMTSNVYGTNMYHICIGGLERVIQQFFLLYIYIHITVNTKIYNHLIVPCVVVYVCMNFMM